jgi:hypothetical protein
MGLSVSLRWLLKNLAFIRCPNQGIGVILEKKSFGLRSRSSLAHNGYVSGMRAVTFFQ